MVRASFRLSFGGPSLVDRDRLRTRGGVSARLLLLDNSYHVSTLDNDKDLIVAFLSAVSERAAGLTSKVRDLTPSGRGIRQNLSGGRFGHPSVQYDAQHFTFPLAPGSDLSRAKTTQ